ncbi:TGS protein [Trinorchestia longiramus]|nr:TGS protein [Trinorchestia longiramus]
MSCSEALEVTNLSELDELLSRQSYILGHQPCAADVMLSKSLSACSKCIKLEKHINVYRWFNHLASFSAAEVNSFAPLNSSSLLSIKGVTLVKNLHTSPSVEKKAMVQKKENKHDAETKGKCNGGSSLKEQSPPPEFIESRQKLWDELKKKQDELIASKVPEPIKVTLPDGSVREGSSWRTTPYDIAKGISQGLAEAVMVAKVDEEVWDLDRPLTRDCDLRLLKFDDPDAKQVFWHSTAHVLGEALERLYAGKLCYGPPIEEGFYYDMHHDGGGVSSSDFPAIEDVMKKISKEKQPFERLEVSKEDLIKMFEYNPFKRSMGSAEQPNQPTQTLSKGCGGGRTCWLELLRSAHMQRAKACKTK